MNIILWAIFGSVAGWIASIIMGRRVRIGVLAHVIVGIIGAVIGGFIMNAFGAPGVTGFNLPSMVVAILGSTLLLFVVSLFAPKTTKNVTESPQETQSSTPPKVQPKKKNLQTPNQGAGSSPTKTEPKKAIVQIPTPEAKSSVAPMIQQIMEKLSPPKTSAKKLQSGNIFVSYRRTDSADVAGRIYDRLIGDFGKAAIFKDVDSIPLGLDFKEYLEQKVGECNVLLAIIGDRWLEASDPTGKRRLEDPNDFVRIEIESALGRGIPVVPLLVRGASMPSEDQLPGGLKKLIYRNGLPIRHDPDFHRDMDRLISALKRYVEPNG